MTSLLKPLLLAVALVPTLAAAEEAAAVRKGATVHVCGCAEGCQCATIKAASGTCRCGKALVPAKVTAVEGTAVTVDRGGQPGESNFKATYKCGCGPKCHCKTVALAPGQCTCGKELVKVN